MKILDVSYAPPQENDPPLLDENTTVTQPCAVIWRPEIWCDNEMRKRDEVLATPFDIPWKTMNIVEVRVDSRRVYELLCIVSSGNVAYQVRICPERPDEARREAALAAKPENAVLDLACFCRPDKWELDMASKCVIEFEHGTIATDLLQTLLRNARVAVFPFLCAGGIDYMKYAIEFGCGIVASDAGNAEEYLSKYAPPGTWHVIHQWKQKNFVEAVKDLLGLPNSITQCDYVDQAIEIFRRKHNTE